MNNTLDFSRLGKVIKHDGASFAQNLGLALIILWAIPVVMWLFASLTPSHAHMDAFSRIGILNTLGKILLIIAPARLYKYCNDQRKGIGYAMMPASSLEKFISMVFYCVIVAPIYTWLAHLQLIRFWQSSAALTKASQLLIISTKSHN